MAGFLRTAAYVLLISIVYRQAVNFFGKKLPQSIDGHVAPGWENVADIFKKFINNGQEKGGTVTVYYKGEPVVAYWGGYADERAYIKWTRDTLAMYCSVTKLTHVFSVGKLVDRGLLDYESPVSSYWPEFGQNGKDKITLAQLLSHQAGLVVIDETFSVYDIDKNPEKVGRILAAQKPNWLPGTKHAYHSITIGALVDQIVRRVDPQHRSVSQFFHEEFAETFGIDFFVGLPKSQNYRTAFTHSIDMTSWDFWSATQYWGVIYDYLMSPDSLFTRALDNPTDAAREDLFNQPQYREVKHSSTHGYGTGESMAKLLGILANGGEHQGLQMLSPSTIKRMSQPDVSGADGLTLRNITYGPGTIIHQNPSGTQSFGHYGAGGQIGWADPDNQLAWTYVTTYHSVHGLGDSPKVLELEAAIYECLQHVKAKEKRAK